jgi:hypothetical protein
MIRSQVIIERKYCYWLNAAEKEIGINMILCGCEPQRQSWDKVLERRQKHAPQSEAKCGVGQKIRK